MDNNQRIQENIEYISSLTGRTIEFNKEEIESEYALLHKEKTGIAVKILTVLGGIFATIMFVIFLITSGLYKSNMAITVVGFAFTGASAWINRHKNRLIFDTLSISAYAIGLTMIAYGLNRLKIDDTSICIIFILISLAAIAISKNYILTFCSILLTNGSFIYLIMNSSSKNLIHIYDAVLLVILTFTMLREAKFLANKKISTTLYDPLRIGLIISLIMGLLFVGQRGIHDFGIKHFWISSVITIPVVIYIISIIAKRTGVTKAKDLALVYLAALIFTIPTALSPAISGALVIILLCFLVNYKNGLAVGIIAFIYFISQYYYDLSFTLLTKSIIMLTSGIVFLLLYVFTHKKLR